jgi:hypothetical protein
VCMYLHSVLGVQVLAHCSFVTRFAQRVCVDISLQRSAAEWSAVGSQKSGTLSTHGCCQGVIFTGGDGGCLGAGGGGGMKRVSLSRSTLGSVSPSSVCPPQVGADRWL